MFYVINIFKGPQKPLVRPPGALPEDEFLAVCIRCGQCSQVCPYHSIHIADGKKGFSIGTPYLNLREKPCFLCKDFHCIETCPSKALVSIEKQNVKMGLAQIDTTTCNAWLGDECRMCYVSCPFYDKAIQLPDFRRPVISPENCVGCGVCEYVCVKDNPAIKVNPMG
ncbi:hypothetical protein BHU72_03615 [Desulfuribacillus stibiiarsenatis]|uniref:4Fe-4S ferredoxin-type domain-containing protein n=2 Tax=Desulfuribacillus stibiiarsenatis TaxID=1390249 RepID=A0A1E5L742_9FIRM|nr:hypothetical protein BHU72_03615 [Desulfuribacillus stibiiarsenatis]